MTRAKQNPVSPSTTRVFVYGTLMRGEPNHGRLALAAFGGAARTRPQFRMISLGGFPAILSGGGTAIEGELYDVEDGTLARLDSLEGHPRFYRRTPIVLADGGLAEAYVLQEANVRRGGVIASGSWRSWCADRDWRLGGDSE